MPNFVDDMTDIAGPKVQSRLTPAGMEDKTLRAEDWNEARQALYDLRDKVVTLLATSGFDAFFGSGIDGSVTFDGVSTVLGVVPSGGTYTLTRDIWPNNMVIAAGVTVNPRGWLIVCKGDITGSGKIAFNGAHGSGSTGGGSVSSQTLPGSNAGGSGTNGAGSATSGGSNCPVGITTGNAGGSGSGTGPSGAIGQGGTGGGNGGAAQGGVATNTLTAAQGYYWSPVAFFSARSVSGSSIFTMGSGGGGGAGNTGASGGGGGASGGAIHIAARSITGVSIEAKGGNGANGTGGNSGGGGGGPGGIIRGYFFTGNAPVTDVSGGTGGASSGTGGAGGDGGDGIADIVILT